MQNRISAENREYKVIMAKVLKATDAAKELVRTAGMIDTEFYQKSFPIKRLK